VGRDHRALTAVWRRRPPGFRVAIAAGGLLAWALVSGHAIRPPLKVCADPNNLPYSNERAEGFENKLAELVAAEMRTTVRYTWWAQRRGFVRNTIRTMACDVIMGLPSSYELTLQTRPYYRSSYVFVWPKDRPLTVRSFDDEVLRKLRIGVHVIGDDYANAPPAHALSRRGIVTNLVGYSIYGDYSRPNPPANLVEAVARHEVDLAVIWGPLAGYFARLQPVPLEMTPVSPEIDLPFLPFVFDIAMGVRHGEFALRDRLDEIILRRGDDIDRLLEEYGVPFTRRVRRQPGSPAATH
jgi:mxaJ protein